MSSIRQSVGVNGKNLYKDTRVVQKLLNRHMPASWARLDVDGICGNKTIKAIRWFQKYVLSFSRPDGRVDPHGRTLAALNGQPYRPAATEPAEVSAETSDESKQFAAAIKAAKRQVDTDVTLAPWRSHIWSLLSQISSHRQLQVKIDAGIRGYLFGDARVRRGAFGYFLATRHHVGTQLRASYRVQCIDDRIGWHGNEFQAVILGLPELTFLLVKPRTLVIIPPRFNGRLRRETDEADLDSGRLRDEISDLRRGIVH